MIWTKLLDCTFLARSDWLPQPFYSFTESINNSFLVLSRNIKKSLPLWRTTNFLLERTKNAQSCLRNNLFTEIVMVKAQCLGVKPDQWPHFEQTWEQLLEISRRHHRLTSRPNQSGVSMLQDTVHDILRWSNNNRFKLNRQLSVRN